jgi:hypothetical protein
MATVTVAGTGVGVDLSEWKGLTKALRLASDEAPRELRKRLRAAGEVMAEAARHIAGEHSTTIPDTIKVRTAGATVAVTAGSPESPLARLYELGNSPGRRRASASGLPTFRHPVFGKDTWVDQPRWRFLTPAATVTMPIIEREVAAALEDAARVITEAFQGGHLG